MKDYFASHYRLHEIYGLKIKHEGMTIKTFIYSLLILSATVFFNALLSNTAKADSAFYGNLHLFVGKVEGVSGLNLNSYASKIGNKGVNLFNENWLLSHNVELALNTFNDANKGGGTRKLPSGIDNNENGNIELRQAWLGIKPAENSKNLGEFRVGRHRSLYDIVDDGQNLLTKVGQAFPSFGQLTEQLLYVNKSGQMAYSIAYAPFENNARNRVVSGLLNYASGPYYAGLALEKGSGLSTGAKVSIGLDQELHNHFADHYKLGLTYDKQMGSGAKSITLTGLISIQQYYFGAEWGKVLDGDILNPDGTTRFSENTKNKALELGYQLNKSTRFYIDYSNLGNRKETSLAVKYTF